MMNFKRYCWQLLVSKAGATHDGNVMFEAADIEPNDMVCLPLTPNIPKVF
jgi:hypothetical protein